MNNCRAEEMLSLSSTRQLYIVHYTLYIIHFTLYIISLSPIAVQRKYSLHFLRTAIIHY